MLSERIIGLMEARALDAELLDRMGFSSDVKNWPVTGDRGDVEWHAGEALIIPFVRDGKVVRRKFKRTVDIPGAPAYLQEKGGLKIAFNEDCLRDSSLHGQPVIITEGELDCVAALQCGFARSISVPDGAPPPGDRSQEDLEASAKYSWLTDLHALLKIDTTPVIIIASDGDDNGAAMLQDLATLLGRFRCKFVTYPKAKDPERRGRPRLKDLNEVLEDYGPAGVKATIDKAAWLKVEGVFTMSELPPVPNAPIYDIGFELLGDNYKLRLGDFAVWTGIPSHGKALALDTRIPTPTGWTTMGEIRVGDRLLDEAGKPCTVTFATDVMLDRPCYRMAFSGGGEVVADAEHLWLTNSEPARRSARLAAKRPWPLKPRGKDQSDKRTFPSVVTTKEIADTLISQGKVNHQVALCAPIEPGLDPILPLDPYILGAWLGDGHASDVRITSGDQDVAEMEAILRAAGADVVRARTGASWSLALTTGRTGSGRGKVKAALRSLNLIGNKHIPAAYLRASAADRLSLLQGLMDTDGHATKDGQCEFTSVNKVLADAVMELVCSLGIKAGRYDGTATIDGREVGPKYRISWFGAMPVFRLKRKLGRLHKAFLRGVDNRAIIKCDPVDSVPVRCIQVDSPSHLFLCTERFIPTHNTTVLNDVLCRTCEAHDLKIAWASFEQRPQTDQRRYLRTWYLREKPVNWTVDMRDRADEWIDRHHVFLVPGEDDDVTLEWLLEKMEVAVMRHGVHVIVVDPWNEMDHSYNGRSETEAQYINRAIKTLRRFARAFSIHLIVVAHPTKLQKAGDGRYPIPSLYDINGGAVWHNKADLGVIVYRENEDDTRVKVAKSRYHDQIGRPGSVMMQFCADDRRFRETSRGGAG